MRKALPLLLGLLAGGQAALHAQQPADLDQLEARRGVYLQRPTFEPYTGPVVAMWDNATVRERGTLVDGRWDGVHEMYYQSGVLSVRETYHNGVLDGPFESYFKTGSPSDKGTYTDGKLDGPYESYWLRMPAERGAFSDGSMCGEWVRFYPKSSYGLRVESTADYPPCPTAQE